MIDLQKVKEHEDKVDAIIDCLMEYERWVLYQALYNSGLRIADAPRMIRQLAPRVEQQPEKKNWP